MSIITLTCYGSSKTLDIDKLEPYQIDLVRGYISYQIGKVRNRIIHKKQIPPQAMVKLQQRLLMLIGMLDTLTGYGSVSSQSY